MSAPKTDTSTKSYLLDFANVRELEPAALSVLAIFIRSPGQDGTAPRLQVKNAVADVMRILSLSGLEASFQALPDKER